MAYNNMHTQCQTDGTGICDAPINSIHDVSREGIIGIVHGNGVDGGRGERGMMWKRMITILVQWFSCYFYFIATTLRFYVWVTANKIKIKCSTAAEQSSFHQTQKRVQLHGQFWQTNTGALLGP